MSAQNHYNLTKLIRIEVEDIMPIKQIIFKEKTTFFGLTLESEGWYGWNVRIDTPIEEFLKSHYNIENLFISENVIWEKPYVRLHFQDKHKKIQHFESFKEAQDFAASIKLLTKTNWIMD